MKLNLDAEHKRNYMIIVITREGVLRKNIVAVLRSRTFSLKINKLPIFSEITQE